MEKTTSEKADRQWDHGKETKDPEGWGNMSKEAALIISSIILGLAVILHGGIYDFYTEDAGVVHKYNKITGKVELCLLRHKCKDFEEKGPPEKIP